MQSHLICHNVLCVKNITFFYTTILIYQLDLCCFFKQLQTTKIATNMTKIKHHYDDKFLANKGIDY
jgi:hypothetical protein